MIKKILLSSFVLSFITHINAQQGTCGSPIPLTCGQTVNGDNSTYSNVLESYGISCAFSNKEGNEIVYQITPPNSGTVTANLTNVTQGKGLKIVFINTCSPMDCIAMSNENPISNDQTETISVVGGTSYLLVIDGNDVEDTATFSLEVTCNQTTGIETTLQDDINLFPNPANDIINIKGVNTRNTNIEVFDITGKKVSNYVTVDQRSIDISSLNKGAYFIRFNRNGEIANKKFTVN